jgi:hypothetical protein
VEIEQAPRVGGFLTDRMSNREGAAVGPRVAVDFDVSFACRRGIVSVITSGLVVSVPLGVTYDGTGLASQLTVTISRTVHALAEIATGPFICPSITVLFDGSVRVV